MADMVSWEDSVFSYGGGVWDDPELSPSADLSTIFGTDDELWNWDLGGLWSGVKETVSDLAAIGTDIAQTYGAAKGLVNSWNVDGVSQTPVSTSNSGTVHPNLIPAAWNPFNWFAPQSGQGQQNPVLILAVLGVLAFLAFK